MSLRLRLLLLIAAVNVGVLLMVVWLGQETAGTLEPVGPGALLEAFRAAGAEDPSGQAWTAIRGLVRLPGGTEDFESVFPQGSGAEVRAIEERLRRLIAEEWEGLDYDRAGLTFVSRAKRAEWQAFYVAFNEYAHFESLEGLKRIYILLCFGTLLLILGTYLVLSKVVLRPLEELSAAADAVAAGHPTAPVPRPRGSDEVANLVDNFNTMAQEVLEYQQHLEERVLDALGRATAAENRLVVAQRLAATGTLAAGFAHEINNPLGGILNALRKLEEGGLSPDRREQYYGLALDGLNRIRTTVERMLHFTPRQREPADVDVGDVYRAAVRLAAHRAERRGVQLDVRPYRPVRGVVGDNQELTQAILNLILNAVDAIPEGRGGTILVDARQDGDEVIVEVTDDGVGMDPETARRCVDLFYSTKPEGEGTGLGLAIVQHIVTDHGGSLEIDSEKGRGTTVRLRLPVTEGP